MTEEQYEMIKKMANSDGWRIFISDIEKEVSAYNNITDINEIETLIERKGKVEMCQFVLGYVKRAETKFNQGIILTNKEE